MRRFDHFSAPERITPANNPKTQEEREGRIARLGTPFGGLAQVGVDSSFSAAAFAAAASPSQGLPLPGLLYAPDVFDGLNVLSCS